MSQDNGHNNLRGAKKRPNRKPTIWVVEDEPEITCLFAEVLIDFNGFLLDCVDHASKVHAEPGDLIFLDLHGTHAKDIKTNGAKLITMSGDTALEPDVPKPFRFADIRLKMRAARAEASAALEDAEKSVA